MLDLAFDILKYAVLAYVSVACFLIVVDTLSEVFGNGRSRGES